MAKIFLVDDDRNLAHLTKMALIKNGYDVVVFHEAQGVMEALKHQRPSLILMDIMMPGVNGGEAVKKIKEDLNLKDVPVVFLTALVPGEKDGSDETGINVDGRTYRTFGKPYEIAELLKLVKNTLV